jgi:hypothetical protein
LNDLEENETGVYADFRTIIIYNSDRRGSLAISLIFYRILSTVSEI